MPIRFHASQEMIAPAPTDAALALASSPLMSLRRVLLNLRSSSTHTDVFQELYGLQLIIAGIWRTPVVGNTTTLAAVEEDDRSKMTWWQLADLDRFFDILPSCTQDYHLFVCLLQTIQKVAFQPEIFNADENRRFNQPLQVYAQFCFLLLYR